MQVSIYNQQQDLNFSTDKLPRLVQEVLALEDECCDEVAINFVDTETICQLHQDFFQDPSPTDCISFPLDDIETPGYRMLGEIFVCPETALQYAQANNVDPHQELTLYVVHGLLHLLGYDDIEKKDRLAMRKAEKKHMEHLVSLDLCL